MMKSSTLFEHGPLPPPTSTSRPPDLIHVIVFPRPSPFSRSSASVYYTERKPKNKKRGRPGNEATSDASENFWNAAPTSGHVGSPNGISRSNSSPSQTSGDH